MKLSSTETGGKNRKTRTKRSPEPASTSGYCHEILLLHFRQAPPWAMKLAIGKSSTQDRVVLQEKHFDLPFRLMPVFQRSETTLRKLPMMVPRMNEKTRKKLCIYFCFLSWYNAVIIARAITDRGCVFINRTFITI